MNEEKVYVVGFNEDSYATNVGKTVLRTSMGERRVVYHIEAENAEEAYKKGVQRMRQGSDCTFRLNQCIRLDIFLHHEGDKK